MRKVLLKIRFWLAPAGSRRERAYHALRVGLAIWPQSGLRRALQLAPSWMRAGWRVRALSDEPAAHAYAYSRWQMRT
jgi:hypothetical protein